MRTPRRKCVHFDFFAEQGGGRELTTAPQQSEPRAEKVERVDTLLAELGLTAAADTKVGDAMNRGISGGQAKRLNIGLGLLTEPMVLFLDEPTTGLDSATADDIMELVHALARRGRTVVRALAASTPSIRRLPLLSF
jgi:ATP-binding cassette subfamily G (WHITE) protein 2